jgi:predicted protein tyrosine phosphatase
MHPLPGRISICGKRELDKFAGADVTHILSIEDPEVVKSIPPWFNGVYFRLQFHDFVEPCDGLDAVLPGRTHAREILRFGAAVFDARTKPAPHLLVHCAAGISRSTAAAFAILAQALGPGRETEAINHVVTIRPECFPNGLLVQHADELLSRGGALTRALASVHQQYERGATGGPA